MSLHVVISADQLTEENVEEIGQACQGWTTWERLPQSVTGSELETVLGRTNIVVGWTNTDALLRSPVTHYLCGSAGYDAYQHRGLSRKPDFQLTHAGDIMGATIAEHCLAMQFALARELNIILKQQTDKHYERRWKAREIAGSTACIVGLGGSGTALAQRCRALGQRVIGVCRNPDRHQNKADVLYSADRLIDAVREADHVFALLPGGQETLHTFRKEVFDAMKPGACFYTASRGSVTHESDLVDALRSRLLGGAGIDVFEIEPLPPESSLWTLPNVIVSPHSAGLSRHLNERLTRLFIDNLMRLRDGKPLMNQLPGNLLD